MIERLFICFVTFVFFFTSFASAQTPSPTPLSVNRLENLQPLRADGQDSEDLMKNMKGYRKPPVKLSDNARNRIKISQEEKDTLKPLVKENKLKILKVFSAPSCVAKLAVDTSDKRCVESYDVIPVSFYSFIWSEHGETASDFQILEDLLIAGNKTSTHGLMIDLGEDEIGRFDKKSETVKMLMDYPIAKTASEAEKQRQNLETGISYQNTTIASSRKLAANHIYLMRLVAYKVGSDIGSFGNQDSIILLKVHELNKYNMAVILWKKLSEKEAPRLSK